MQVETFEEISVDVANDGTVVNELVSEESLALIETLGLQGQRGLVRRAQGVDTDDTTETRIPYRQITAEESRIYSLVMPEKTDLPEFDLGPIPLRVLQVAAHARPMFTKLVVWHQANVKEDPILVGIRTDPASKWGAEQTFILARWGEVLVPLDELRLKARDILIAKSKLAISEAKAEVAKFESTLKEQVDVFLRGERVSTAYVSMSLGG